MCGRYFVEIDEQELKGIVESVERSVSEQLELPAFKVGEVFPGNTVPVILSGQTLQMTWGFPSLAGKRPHINARSETAATKRTFAEAMQKRSCLIPASGYYEWKSIGDGHKEKYEFRLPDSSLMLMAGIYSTDGRFAILTREAALGAREIHDRMPMIVPQRLKKDWLMGNRHVIQEAITEIIFAPLQENSNLPMQMTLF